MQATSSPLAYKVLMTHSMNFIIASTIQTLTIVDKELLDALGFTTTALMTMVIELSGATSLTEIANHFYLYDNTGSGPSLKFSGADFIAGRLALGRRLGQKKRLKDMRSPGKLRAPISTRSGPLIITGTTSRISPLCRGAAPHCNRWSPVSIRISTATVTSVLPRRCNRVKWGY